MNNRPSDKEEKTREDAINETLAFLANINRADASSDKMAEANYKIGEAVREHYLRLRSKRETAIEFETQLSSKQPINRSKARKLVSELADDLEVLAEQKKRELPYLAKYSEICFQSFTEAVKFREAFSDEYKDGIIRTFRALDDLSSYLADSENALYGMREAIGQIPPLTPKLQIATRLVISVLDSAAIEYATVKARVGKVREQILERFSVSSIKKSSGEITMNKTSILFLAADPTDASRLRLGEEAREIQEKLQLAKMRELFELHQRFSVRPSDISQALLDIQPQIVHFSGHGTSTGALCFENQMGEMQLIQPDALAALFEQFADQVKCVVLNACYSEMQANAIVKHIGYVVGMNQAIGDKAAIAFAIGFYQALGAGRTIEEAYKLGVVQIRLQGVPEHLTPVLNKKEQT